MIVLDNLLTHVATCRFLPTPPADLHFVGDGDFRAIGTEFLGWFISLGGLRASDRVLEIGCGSGRMAVPLTQYLTADHASYDGIDVVKSGIDWCQTTITPVYERFRFQHLDAANDIYNPGGTLDAGAITLPYADASFDFILLTSVFTHLQDRVFRRYCQEISRVLRPGGHCFSTFFLIDWTARGCLAAGQSQQRFDPAGPGPDYLADPAHPSAAIAYDEDYVLSSMESVGLGLSRPLVHGCWSGRPGQSYQDIAVFRKAELV